MRDNSFPAGLEAGQDLADRDRRTGITLGRRRFRKDSAAAAGIPLAGAASASAARAEDCALEIPFWTLTQGHPAATPYGSPSRFQQVIRRVRKGVQPVFPTAASSLTPLAATHAGLGLDRYWRNLRTHTMHDPIDYKLLELGEWALKQKYPKPTFYS